jgi:hypothetical protein
MSKRKSVTITITCDRCGAEGVENDPDGAFYAQGANVKVDHWGRTYDGSTGGAKRDLDLCSKCTDGLLKFLRVGRGGE